MDPKYTPMGGRSKLEKFVESNPDFKSSIRFEPSTAKEGFVVFTDGSFSFGQLSEEEFQQLLDRKLELSELSAKPTIFDYIDCDTIERNTKRFEQESSQSNLTKYAKAVDTKVAKFIPNKVKAVVALVFLATIVVLAFVFKDNILSTTPKGYSPEFYSSGMVQTKLTNLSEKWTRFEETKETKNEKLARHTAKEIKEFHDDVDKERLTEEERTKLTELLDSAKIYLAE